MLHDLVIWPKAVGFTIAIIDDLRLYFNVVAQFTIRWDEDKLYDNYKVFYSKSWQSIPSSKLRNAVKTKAEHCGEGDFVLIVFEDAAPEMDYEQTADGRSLVNTRVFNKKKEYRELTGGGHLIHTSNSGAETNRDLTLLLGVGTEDFLKGYGESRPERIRVCRNCTGVDGYKSLSSFFYTLNHTIDYVVLRNFECLPDRFFEEGHDDIDLLVENLSYVVNLTSAKPISGSEGRVDYSVRIGDTDVQFDFRYVGDNYYDPVWERSILDNRVLERDLFNVPGKEDIYYTLLYHAYVQKTKVKDDYHSKLAKYGREIGVAYLPIIKDAIPQLDSFMERSGYEYIAPKDKTVVYNEGNLEMSDCAFKHGRCIKHTEEKGANGYSYTSKVFDNTKSMVKKGTSWLLDNEAFFLDKLSDYPFFPDIVSRHELDKGMATLELSRFEGRTLDVFLMNLSNHRVNVLRSLVAQLTDILRILSKNGIEHRDISPSNIIVCRNKKTVNVGLVDFGWAAENGNTEARTPKHLGGRFSDGDNHSDRYAVGVILMDYWPDLFSMRLIASSLFKVSGLRTVNSLNKTCILSRLPLGLHDRFRLLLRRHQRLSMIWHKLRM